ncbi:hypothetical protein [Butyrivibrio fibrisolvens]|uniref:hypothetical protein n=1 Tax=Butyrivibrio fibrisolvens TaxID=831 RepID=UPI0003B5BDD5|nr:hypothetical protein [Butyrivibrio fibrisolvens]
MPEKRVKDELVTYVDNNTKSVALMDRFEGKDREVIYKRIALENMLFANGAICHLVIERANRRPCVGDITFTDFKKGYSGDLCNHVKAEVTSDVIKKYSGKKEIYYFDKPFRLRAQNSGNRTGYGSIWEWSYGGGEMVHEGTLYGETTDYVFAGVYID